MGRPAILKVDIIADAKGVGRGVDEADRKFGRLGGALGKHGAVIGAGLAGLGIAAAKFGKDSVAAFTEAQQAAARLDDAYKRFPATNDVTRASFDALNASMARKTRFDDDALASGQAVLAQYKLTGSQIQQLTPLLADYAARTGKDIPDAAGVLGKALLGKGKALAEVGIKFKDAGSTGANFEQIMGGLRTQVGGFATKEGKTAAGQAAILRNQFGEVKEQVGSKLVPVLTTLAGKLLSLIDFVQRNSAVIKPFAIVIGSLAVGILAVNKAAQAYRATQLALNIVLSANPIGLLVIGIAALVAGLVIAYRRSEAFRNVLQGILDKVRAIGRAIANSPIGKAFGAIFSTPTMGMVAPITGGVGGLEAPINRIATASLGAGSEFGGVPLSRPGGAVIIDRRQIDLSVHVDGALDTPAVARQIERILRDQALRLGRVTALA